MECIEARALKTSVLSQMAMKTNSQNDDFWCLTGINSVVGSDDFLVEDLLNLDFPEIDLQDSSLFHEDNQENSSEKRDSKNSSMFSGTDDVDSLSAGELNVPVEDMENLEWLSQFVDDSSSELSLLLPAESFSPETGGATANRVEPMRRTFQKNILNLPVTVQRKPRSQRSRLHRELWSLESPPFSTIESSSASSHGSTTLSPIVSALSPFLFPNRVSYSDRSFSLEKPPVKKLKRKPEADAGFISGRRCTHCQVQKTPQWRTGPLGPKTLCNACGVRFKSGRLFPEYRPACSPTFSLETHSNSHRKVLEMRRKKEIVGVVEPNLNWAVPSF